MPQFIRPNWPAPAQVVAFSTTRTGGHSAAPFASFNLGHHVGDAPGDLRANYRLLAGVMPQDARLYWLNQVHGTTVVEAGRAGEQPDADAVFSRSAQWCCAVLTADCLPVLFCDRRAEVVAAAHAGWRGLAAGVLEATVDVLACDPENVLAWLGPAIGPAAFEVGAEVRDAFVDTAGVQQAAVEAAFVPSAATPGHFLADLYALARARLHALGVTAIYGGGFCTFTESERFFSYRREGRTGRMASVIALAPHSDRG